MKHRKSQPAELKGAGILALLLLLAFASEVVVMQLSSLLPGLGRLAGGVLDALIMLLVLAGPLWFFFFRVLGCGPGTPEEPQRDPKLLLRGALIGVFLVETLAMLLLPDIFPAATPRHLALLDASLISLFLLFFLLRRNALNQSVLPMDTPLRLYFLLLCTIFLADLLQEFLLSQGGAPPLTPGRVLPSLLTTLCGAPLLWFLVVQPLQSAARRERNRVAAVHAQVTDAVVVINEGGTIAVFNPAAETIFGYRQAAMVGNSAAILLDQGEAGLEALLARAAEGGGESEPVLSEIGCRRRDGRRLVMNVSVSRLLLERQPPEFLLIMRDITSRNEMECALRESEQRFREIFQQTEDAILFFKPGSCTILDANRKAEAVFGYSRRELQETGLELFCEAAEREELCRAIALLVDGKPLQLDFPCRRRDRARIIASVRGKVMVLQGIPVICCSFRDITERVRMEEQTREIQAKLIQTNKMTSLGLLVSGVAHEINNPNNFIMANGELLSRFWRETLAALKECREENQLGDPYVAGLSLDELSEHSRQLLDGIAEGSHRVDAIVRKLKAFARQERSQTAGEVDINAVIRSAVSLLRHELIKYTDRFHLELGEGLPPLRGHGQQLGQVVINLVMNACQALPDKGSGIWVSTALDQGEGMVVVTVRDEGRGFSAEEGARIMEPFFTTKLDRGGTGLGLSISDSIIKEHGGSLRFTSAPGRGTTFSVRLPAAGSKDAAATAAGAPSGEAPAAADETRLDPSGRRSSS